MPGLSANDFGDSIRFGASTALEDEKDLSKVSCDLHFLKFMQGIHRRPRRSTDRQNSTCFPWGAILMTFECGIRFLTDYLEGDHYFKVHIVRDII